MSGGKLTSREGHSVKFTTAAFLTYNFFVPPESEKTQLPDFLINFRDAPSTS